MLLQKDLVGLYTESLIKTSSPFFRYAKKGMISAANPDGAITVSFDL